MATRTVGIILNGATSRIGSTQHLKNALAPIRAEGGLVIGDDRVMPRVLLVGRDADRRVVVDELPARYSSTAPRSPLVNRASMNEVTVFLFALIVSMAAVCDGLMREDTPTTWGFRPHTGTVRPGIASALPMRFFH